MLLNKLLFSSVLMLSGFTATSQNIDKIINATEVERIEKILSTLDGLKKLNPILMVD